MSDTPKLTSISVLTSDESIVNPSTAVAGTLYASNVSGTGTDGIVTVKLTRGGTTVTLVSGVVVRAGKPPVVIYHRLHLEANDNLKIAANAANVVTAQFTRMERAT